MPCYNSSQFIEFSIRSVIRQTYRDWELIIVDDCSSDSTPDIIKGFAQYDSRIRVLKTSKPSGSPAMPRNIGLNEAKYDLIAFLDSDDIWIPNKLEIQLQLINKEDVAIVYSNFRKINENGAFWGDVIHFRSNHNFESLIYGNEIVCSSAMLNRKKISRSLCFKNIGHEDFLFWLLILSEGCSALNSNEMLVYYRVHNNSVSANKFKVIKWLWNIYKRELKFTRVNSIRCITICLSKSVLKRLR